MVYYQTLLQATTADPKNSETAFEILSGSMRDGLDGWIGIRSSSKPRAQLSRSANLRIHIVDPNIGCIDHKNVKEE
jgi:hypothetical protein